MGSMGGVYEMSDKEIWELYDKTHPKEIDEITGISNLDEEVREEIDKRVRAGIELQYIRNKLVEALVFISNTNGKTKSKKATDKLGNAIRLIDNARSDLENILSKEFNEEEIKPYLNKKWGYWDLTDIYFPRFEHQRKTGGLLK